MNPTDIAVEVSLLSLLNVGVVYLAAFVYALNWSGVMTVMVFASLFTGMAAHALLLKWRGVRGTEVREGLALMMVAFLSSLAVLVVLTYRFSFPSALGISLLSGMISSLFRHLLA